MRIYIKINLDRQTRINVVRKIVTNNNVKDYTYRSRVFSTSNKDNV